MRSDAASWPEDGRRRDPHRVTAAILHSRKVPSRRGGGVFYTVMQRGDLTWSCTCPGFAFAARADGLCVHIDGEKDWDALRIPSLAALLAAC